MCKCLSNLSIVPNWCDTQPYTPYQCATFWCNGYRTKIDAIGAITLKYNITCVVFSAIGIKQRCIWCLSHQSHNTKPKSSLSSSSSRWLATPSSFSYLTTLQPQHIISNPHHIISNPQIIKKRNTHTFHQTLFAWQLYLAQLFILSLVHT